MVLKDVTRARFPAEVASRIYGVIVNDQAVDEAATARRRE